VFDGVKKLALRMSPGGVIRYFARPYIAGSSRDAAFAVARGLLAQRQIASTIDLLGEEAASDAAGIAMRDTYVELVREVAKDPAFADPRTRPTVSLKLSGMIASRDENGRIVLDYDALVARMETVAQAAAECKVDLTIDMEDHRWTTTTLDVYRAVHSRGHAHVGTVLQSRLYRTSDDIEVLPADARIRMVIGVYLEPSAIALTDKRTMKDRLLEQAARLLERGAKVELATHDVGVLERFFKDVVLPKKIPPERYEVQMLLGVPRADAQARLVDGTFSACPGTRALVRLYVPYALSAEDGTAYCRRRLIENPAMIGYGLTNLVRNLAGG